MAGIKINRVTNGNVYVNGNSFLGRVDECTLPTIKFKKAEHKALGMVGSMEFNSGIEKMEAKIKWNAIYEDVLAEFSNPNELIKLQLRANVEERSSTETENVPLVCFMTVAVSDLPLGGFKQHENVELESNLSVYYCKIEYNGVEMVEFDAMANIYKVEGVDLLADYRKNIGG